MKKRFATPKFKQQLKTARGYQRVPSSKPASLSFTILKKRYFWYPLFLVLFAGAMVFSPSILKIYNVEIFGENAELVAQADRKLSEYLDSQNNFFLPRRLVWVLDVDKVSDVLEQAMPNALEVQVERRGFASVSLRVQSRVAEFILDSSSGKRLADWKGGVFDVDEAPPLAKKILEVEMPFENADKKREARLFDRELEVLQKIKSASVKDFNGFEPKRVVFLPVTVTEGIVGKDAYEVEGQKVLEANTVVAQKRYLNEPSLEFRLELTASAGGSELNLLLPTDQDISQVLGKFRALAENFGTEQLKKYSYIDLRYEDKAYLCDKNSPCAQTDPVEVGNLTNEEILNLGVEQ